MHPPQPSTLGIGTELQQYYTGYIVTVQTRDDGGPKQIPGNQDDENVEYKRFVARLDKGYRKKMGHMANNYKYLSLGKWTRGTLHTGTKQSPKVTHESRVPFCPF